LSIVLSPHLKTEQRINAGHVICNPMQCPGTTHTPTAIECVICDGTRCFHKAGASQRASEYFRLHPEQKPEWWRG